MSRKALKSVKDENPDLQKQIGCITGFFQLFDRRRFLISQRTSSHSQHRLNSGGSRNDIKERTLQKTMAKNLKLAKEKQQFSTESSTNSMSSSSCSSTLSSSLEFNRTIQRKSPSRNQMRIPLNPNSEVATKQLHIPGQQSLNFSDIVKDSMHREGQGLSVKTVAKEEKKGHTHTLKYIDSPRPLQSLKSINAGAMVTNVPSHTLAKSKKTPWDSPRLSYDGRDTQDAFKSATKHKELPRLSLDSRFNEGNKSSNLLKGPQKGYGRNSSTMLNQLQEPETSKRSSSVVAKLMGLEALPDRAQICETPLGTSSCSTNKDEILVRSSTNDEYKQHQSSVSPRTCQGPKLPQSKRADSITNLTPNSQFVLESARWRELDASQSFQLQASKGSESDIKASKSSLSVYGEIEKRLAELEFKKSGKDLRALKQILEAMQRYKDSLDVTRDQASNSPSDNRNNSRLHESSKVQSPRIQQKVPTSEMSNSTQGSKLPIVILKPEKVHRKANDCSPREMSIDGKSGLSKSCPGNPSSGRLVNKQTAKGVSSTTRTAKDTFSQPVQSADNKCNNMRTSKLMQSSKVTGDNNYGNLTATGSPRLQKKFGLERRSPPMSPSSDSSINRKHNRQSVNLSSPSTTPRQKFSTPRQSNEHVSEISCHWRDFKHHVNLISPDFESKRSLGTDSDTEVIHIDQSGKINSTSMQLSGMNKNNAVERLLSKEGSKADTVVTAEQPSPVSVLDATFYREDPPSPVKKKSDISKDLGEALSTDDDSEEKSVDLPLSNTTKFNFSHGCVDRDLNTQNLVHILQEIDWIADKFININDKKDPNHKYISEILLASGLLNGFSSSQISHSSGHLINPKLFYALEQIKTNKRHSSIEDSAKKIARITHLEQMQRKLIFDVVSEILVQKLVLESSSSLWCLRNELAGRKLKGKELLDELCKEIDQLQPRNKNASMANGDDNLTSPLCRDLMHHPTIWTNCYSEIPNIVLDIERMIFRDLITEVVKGEVENHPGRHCRQLLFPK